MRKVLVALAALLALTGCTLPTITIGPAAPVTTQVDKTQDDTFKEVYTELFVQEFGEAPSADALRTARDFGKEVCKAYAEGYSSDDLVLLIVNNTDDDNTRTVAILAMAAGTAVYCPEYKER